jgi:hypothetical protein
LENKKRSTETSIILLDKSFFLNILVKKFSKKGGERKPSSYFGKCLLQNEGRLEEKGVIKKRKAGPTINLNNLKGGLK